MKILVIERDGYFIAQTLEKHVVVQGRTFEEAHLFAMDTVLTYQLLEKTSGETLLQRAPDEVWAEWERSSQSPAPQHVETRLSA